MELDKALNYIVKTDGIDILGEERLIGILDEFKAYESCPLAKYILHEMISGGYMNDLLMIGEWNDRAIDIALRFTQQNGFDVDSTVKVFISIASCLNWFKSNEVASNVQVSGEQNANFHNIDPNSVYPLHFKTINFSSIKDSINQNALSTIRYAFGNTILTWFDNFGEFENCQFIATRADDEEYRKDRIESIIILLPELNDWAIAKSLYYKFKEAYTTIFGKPYSVEHFGKYYNGDEFSCLEENSDGFYNSWFIEQYWTILLEIRNKRIRISVHDALPSFKYMNRRFKFDGLDIDSPEQAWINHFTQKGFTRSGAFFKGPFEGIENCIYSWFVNSTGRISNIYIIVPGVNNAPLLTEKRFNTLVDKLNTKYGKPKRVTDKDNNSLYGAIFKCPGGEAIVSAYLDKNQIAVYYNDNICDELDAFSTSICMTLNHKINIQ
jgi:hypothetical protein